MSKSRRTNEKETCEPERRRGNDPNGGTVYQNCRTSNLCVTAKDCTDTTKKYNADQQKISSSAFCAGTPRALQ